MSSHDRTAVTAFVALGANLGDRRASLGAAIESLNSSDGITVVKVSSFIENPAVGMADDAPDFLNAVAQVQTTLAAHSLLKRLKQVRRVAGG